MPESLEHPIEKNSCIISSQFLGSSSDNFHIVHPTTSQTLTVPQHNPLMLECVVSGLSVSYVRWYKDDQDVLTKGRWRMLHSHLMIDSINTSDAGNYSCVVDNKSGVVKHVNYSINVLGKICSGKMLDWRVFFEAINLWSMRHAIVKLTE